MPMSPRETLLCRYRYDPLDRSVDWAPAQQASIQRFYCKSRLASEIQGAAKYSFLQHDDQVFAQQRRIGDKVDTALLATDQQQSVLNALDATQPHPRAYTPYGHHPLGNGLLSLLGFNGERPDPVTGHYHLGNGYRQFNPRLMRFNSPDSWSPFGKGGLNAYMYCGADPINRSDPTGHIAFRTTRLVALTGIGAAGVLGVSGVVVIFMGGLGNDEGMTIDGYITLGTAVAVAAGTAGFVKMAIKPRARLSSSSSIPRRNSSIASGSDNSSFYMSSTSSSSSRHRTATSIFNDFTPPPSPPPRYESLELTRRSSNLPPDYFTTSTPSTTVLAPSSSYPPAQTPIGQRAEEFFRGPDNLAKKKTNIRHSI